MDASFEEKSVWITLAGLVAVFVFYFYMAGRMLMEGVAPVVAYMPVLAATVVMLIVVLALGHAAVAIAGRPEGRDERDRLIEWRSEHNSSWVLGVGVIGAVFALATPISPAWVANGLLMSIFLSEVVKRAFQIHYYRRGI